MNVNFKETESLSANCEVDISDKTLRRTLRGNGATKKKNVATSETNIKNT